MKAFVTGGTGFIGGHVVRKLQARGAEVVALARGSSPALEALGAQVVRGDIGDVESMRGAMRGCDVVYHLAGWYKIGSRTPADGRRINVEGTRNVLTLAHQLGVPRIVYTSTVAVTGDSRGRMADESSPYGGPFLTVYDRTKWLAHHRVAVPLIQKGAPIIIVMPGGVYGPGDTSVVGEMLTLFCRGLLRVLPAPETAFTFAHVEDVAEGHILAAERGQVGESYILAGPAATLGELVRLWARLTGRRPPVLTVPAGLIRPFVPVMTAVGRVVPLPQTFTGEAARSLGVTYLARADKARAALGWQPRSLEEGMRETLARMNCN